MAARDNKATDLLVVWSRGDRLTVRQAWNRCNDGRTLESCKTAVKRLVRKGFLKPVGELRISSTVIAPVYARTSQAVPTKERNHDSLNMRVFRAVRPGEVVTSAIVVGRIVMSQRIASKALYDNFDQGRLARCQISEPGDGPARYGYYLPGTLTGSIAQAVRKAQDAPVIPETVHAPTEALPPFVALFTPPLPKFRIKATRVLRPLSSPVEDAA